MSQETKNRKPVDPSKPDHARPAQRFPRPEAAPVVTAVAILSLALGIGANTAIFSILDSLMLRHCRSRSRTAGDNRSPRQKLDQSYLGADPRSRSSRSTARSPGRAPRFNLAAGRPDRDRRRLLGERPLFRRARRPAILGRTLTPADDRRGGGPDGPVAVISYSFWQRRFGGAADVIGQPLTVERVPFTIVGVTPPRILRRRRRAARSTWRSRSAPSR